MTPAGNPPPLPRQVPERLGGYAVGKPLGCGATGWVFQATRADGARFALKLIHPHLAGSLLEQLLAEARLSERLRSEHTVRVFASGEENGHIYSVMELVEGRSLAELLRERGKLDRESAHRIALGIARGLADLHAAGVAHRDVKPSNVLLGDDGRVVLSDFGIAAEVRADASTSSLDFAGSLAYAAPEQAAQRWDFRSDIYGFGATLVHMLSGSPPERHGLLASLPRGFGRTLTDQLANTDPGLSDVAKRCLATAPSQRFQTADELLQALDQLDLGSGLDRTMRSVRFFWRRNLSRFLNVFARPAVAVGALAAALAVAGGLAYLLFQSSDGPATCQVTAPVNVRAEQGATGEVELTWQRTDSCAPSGYQVAWSTRNDRSGVPASQVKDAQVFDGRREVRISLPGLSAARPERRYPVLPLGRSVRAGQAPHRRSPPGDRARHYLRQGAASDRAGDGQCQRHFGPPALEDGRRLHHRFLRVLRRYQ
jgi:predicted Ser/Thr protein kinase